MSKAEHCTLPKTCSLNLSEGTSSYLGQEPEILEPPLSPFLPSSYPSLSPDHPSSPCDILGIVYFSPSATYLRSYFIVSLLHLESRECLVTAFSAFNLYSKQQPERDATGRKSSLVTVLLKALP